MQCSTVQYLTVRHNTTQCNAMQYNAMQRYAMPELCMCHRRSRLQEQQQAFQGDQRLCLLCMAPITCTAHRTVHISLYQTPAVDTTVWSITLSEPSSSGFPACGPLKNSLLLTSLGGNLSSPIARGEFLQFHICYDHSRGWWGTKGASQPP